MSVKLSFIIPAHNEEERIGRCLDSILRESKSRDDIEIIVVNNASTDDTESIVRRYREVQLVREERKGIVWAHNSHVGNARATEMSVRGELNIGELCRTKFQEGVYAVGFGTDHGTVAAASHWDEPMQRMRVRPAHADTYERLCHDSQLPAFMLQLRDPKRREVREELLSPRLERAIGVVYRPETELQSHYFYASLPVQFDELIWFDETRAVEPLQVERRASAELPETYPFGL